MKSMHFKALPVGHQNRQISSDFLLSSKEIHTFGEKYQFFQLNAIPFSVSIPMTFQKRAFYRLQFLHRKLSIFSEITDFKEIKEISDFNQFSKESLIPFGVLVL